MKNKANLFFYLYSESTYNDYLIVKVVGSFTLIPVKKIKVVFSISSLEFIPSKLNKEEVNFLLESSKNTLFMP